MSEAADFAYGAANAAFGFEDDAALEQAVQTFVRDGFTIVKIPAAPFAMEGPAAAWLIAWASTELGLLSFVRVIEEGVESEWKIAWPFMRGGARRPFTIAAIHRDPDDPEIRLLEGHVGRHALTLFDTFCLAAIMHYDVGETVQTRIGGWASWLQRADTTPDVFRPEDVSASVYEGFRETFEREGVLVIRKEKLVSLLPAGATSPLYELRSPVKAIRWTMVMPDMPGWILTVAIGRADPLDEPDGPDLDIDLCVTRHAWREAEPPEVGDAIEGVIWLQADLL